MSRFCVHHAHARILEVDATAVGTLPGVVDVLTANELTNIRDLPCASGYGCCAPPAFVPRTPEPLAKFWQPLWGVASLGALFWCLPLSESVPYFDSKFVGAGCRIDPSPEGREHGIRWFEESKPCSRP